MPFRDRDRQEMPDVLWMPAEPELGQRAGIGGILEDDRQTDRGLEKRGEVNVTPAEVRREHEAARRIDASRQAHAHAFAHDARMRALHGRHRARQLPDEGLR